MTVRRIKRTSRVQKVAEEVAESRVKRVENKEPAGFVSSGSALLNLALSDNVRGGYALGRVVNLIGDSSSGKTLAALTALAEASINPKFVDYKLIIDDAENALGFNMAYLFGERLEARIESFASNTVLDWYGSLLKLIKEGTPFIYILDSLDSLCHQEDLDKAELIEGDKELKGSYGMGKPKQFTEMMRVLVGKIAATNSLLIIISQTRDNPNPMSFVKKTRSGGKALKFYSTHEIWLDLAKKIKSKDRVIGSDVNARVTKNKITGKERTASFSIYYDLGIDDIGSCVDFMIDEKYWTGGGKAAINTDGFTEPMKRGKLIEHIEENNLERALRNKVGTAWKEIEDSLKLGRKRRY